MYRGQRLAQFGFYLVIFINRSVRNVLNVGNDLTEDVDKRKCTK